MPTQAELKSGFILGDWEVVPGQGVLRRGDHEERPEPLVFEVLMALASRDGDLVSRDELIDEVWGGRPTSDEPINRCLSQLRGHLGDRERPYRYIETLTRRGYRLNQPVQLLQPSAPAAEEVIKVDNVRNQSRLWIVVGAIVVTVLIAAVIRGGLSIEDDVQSVAVLPFDNLSGNPDDQYLVSGFKEELVQTLHIVPDLEVKSIRVNYPDLEVTEIAELLDVDAVLSGTVRRDGGTLKISYQITDGEDSLNISSGNFAGQLEGIFGLQERLALMVRNDLMGESPQQLISTSRPASFDAYDRYMRGIYALERRTNSSNLEDAIELFQETIQLDPQFGPAYLSLATAYALLPDYRKAPLEESLKLAIDTAERGVAVDDSIRDAASAVFGYVYHKQRQWSKAEQAYVRATNARIVDSNSFNWYARMLAGVGRREDALRQALAAQKIDPSSAIINSLVATLYTWLNDPDRATEFYERSNQLGASNQYHYFGYALVLLREGRLDEARELASVGASSNELENGWVRPVFAGLADDSQRGDALAAIAQASNAGQLDPRIKMALHTLLGDVDGAMELANELAQPGQHLQMDLLFLPELQPLRQHSGFFDLMDKLGVQDYWDEKGCVWLDDSVSCPD